MSQPLPNIVLLGNINSIHFRKRIEVLKDSNFVFHVIDLVPRGGFAKSPFSVDSKNIVYHLISTRLKSKIRYFLYFWRIRSIIKKIKPAMLHCYGAGVYGFLGLLLSVHPTIISIYGSEVFCSKNRNLLYKKLIGRILRNVDILTYASIGMKNFLISQFNIPLENLVKLYWGVNTQLFYQFDASLKNELRRRMGIPESAIVFFSNRRILPLYNVKYILSAFYKVNKIFNNIRLILIKGDVGSYEPYFLEMESLAEKEIKKNQIILIKELISLEEMAKLYNISDFFISLPDSDELSTAILEGMACGSAPILSNLEAYTELKENTGSFFIENPENIEEIANLMQYLIKNYQNVKERFSQRNQQYICNNMTYGKVRNQLLDMYNNLWTESGGNHQG